MTNLIDHVGPMKLTKKSNNNILVVVDGFTKLVWLYRTKSTYSKSVIQCLERNLLFLEILIGSFQTEAHYSLLKSFKIIVRKIRYNIFLYQLEGQEEMGTLREFIE